MNTLQFTNFGSNAAADIYIHIVLKGLLETTTALSAVFNVKLTYYCILNNINEAAGSS